MINRRFYTLTLAAIAVFLVVLWLKTDSQRFFFAVSPVNEADNVDVGVAPLPPYQLQINAKVKVSVYYEVLCPDSINFVVNQLYPTFNSIGYLIHLELIPYGKASYTPVRDTYRFECQHGPQECHGNRIHSCALHFYPNVSRSLPFVQCSLAASDPVSASQQCAQNNGLDWRLVSQCADGNQGNDLLHANGVKTEALNPRMVFVPWILINDVYTDELEELALNNLIAVVCNAYTGEKPVECLG